MKEFFTKAWVRIMAWIFVVIGTLTLILGGTEVGDIVRVPELVFGIVEAVGLLIIFIRSMLQKKDTDKK
jgi:formate/nitrite transporter FocA (FNT family)